MEFRTQVKIEPSGFRISYPDPVMFIGSCFAAAIGRKFEAGHLPVLVNPAGTVYNPVSVFNTLGTFTGRDKFKLADLYNNNGIWLSFNHYTDFISDDPEDLLDKINNKSEEAARFIEKAKVLFITFGTARVYRWKKTGEIISNCHKLPSSEFSHELLSVDDIVSLWWKELDRLKLLFPDLKIVFTVSPVRHWKDGAHGNLVSKSVLVLAIEKLLDHPSVPGYFPAYEIVIDELRDYRFYSEDMLHPSDSAVSYIWESFVSCYFEKKTYEIWQEVFKITKAFFHKINTVKSDASRNFAERMLESISSVLAKEKSIDLSAETDYFRSIIG